MNLKTNILIGFLLFMLTRVMCLEAFAAESFKDTGGRTISVDEPFHRIISLYGAHTENLFALGLDDEIIGVSRNEDYPPEAQNKPVFSYHDGPEKFMAARPDLVLIRPMIDRGYARLVTQLERSGIVVVSLQPADVTEMFDYWKILGALTGTSEKAEEMVDDFKHSVETIKEQTRHIKNRKKVYFEAMHRQMRTFSDESMAVFVLEAAGGINIASDAMPSRGTNIGIYGKEKILAHSGEIDVFLVQTGRMNRASVETIKNEPGFGIIKAVKNNEIYLVEEMLVSRPTQRLLAGIKEIGKILYPEVF